MSTSAAELQVLEAERAWLSAHLNNDVAALDWLMAEEYSQIRSDGAVAHKSDVIGSFETGDRHWDEATSDELQVNVYGEAAVVIGRWWARGANAGAAFDYIARYMSVWILRDGRWQMVSDQSTEIA